MTKKKGFLDFVAENTFIHILLSIILGFLVGAIFLVIMGLSVGAAYGRLLNSVTSLKGFSYVIVYSVPYIVAGLSVAFSFKTGVFNIGAEGQFVMGSMAAAVVGIMLPDLPKPVLIPLCFLAAMVAGAFWGLIVSVLKTKWGINEVLSMIMFNWIAFYLSNFIAGIPAIHSDGSAEATKNISNNASLLFSKDFIKRLGIAPTANWGFIMAILAMLLVWFIIDKTTLGYRLKPLRRGVWRHQRQRLDHDRAGHLRRAGGPGRRPAADGHGRAHQRVHLPGGLRLRGHRRGADRLLQPLRSIHRRHILRRADLRRQQAEPGGSAHPADQRHRGHSGLLHLHLRHLRQPEIPEAKAQSSGCPGCR